jgi:hypothetical protein
LRVLLTHKIPGTFSKGALKVRVASGDVDVFLGDELRLDSDKCQREEEMHAQWPVMAGDDHYDPYQPREGHDCISRFKNIFLFKIFFNII